MRFIRVAILVTVALLLVLAVMWIAADLSADRRQRKLSDSWRRITGVPLSLAPNQTPSPSIIEVERHAARNGLAFIDRSVAPFDKARREALTDWLQKRFRGRQISNELDETVRADLRRSEGELRLIAVEAGRGNTMTLPRTAIDPLDPKLPNLLHYATLIRYLIASSEVAFEGGRAAEGEMYLAAAKRLNDTLADYPQMIAVLLAIAYDQDVAIVATRWSADPSWPEQMRRPNLARNMWLAQEYHEEAMLAQVAKSGYTEDLEEPIPRLFWRIARPMTRAWMLTGAEETVTRVGSPMADRCRGETRAARIAGHPMWSHVDLVPVDQWHRRLALRDLRIEGLRLVTSAGGPLRLVASRVCPGIEWNYDGTMLTAAPQPADVGARPWSVRVMVPRPAR